MAEGLPAEIRACSRQGATELLNFTTVITLEAVLHEALAHSVRKKKQTPLNILNVHQP
jgi:hypothetical protein